MPPHVLVAHFRPDIVSGAELALADLVAKLTGKQLTGKLGVQPGNQQDERFRVTMLIPGEGRLAGYYRERGFRVWVKEVQTPRRAAPGLHTLQSILLARRLKVKGIDIMLCNTFAAASRVATAARLAGLPLAIYVREYIQDKPLHRAVLGHANRVFVVSADLLRHLSTFCDLGKVRLAYDTIDAQPILERLKAHRNGKRRLLPFGEEYPSKKAVVGLVGRIARFKQQDLFLQSVPFVLAEFPQAQFIIAGSAQESEKDYEVTVRELAARLGIQNRVTFLGHRQDNIEIMSELSVLCLTSSREPLGRVILEAALAGVPVVASDAGGPAEIIEDGVTGFLFPAVGQAAAAQLAAKIVCLLKDDDLRRAMAARASSRIAETFAGPAHARQFEQDLKELLVGRQ